MHGSEQRDRIDDPVQRIPASRAEPAHGRVGRGRSERDQSGEGDCPDQEIEPQHDLARHLEPVEMLVDHVERQMQAGIGGRGHAKGAAGEDQPRIMQDALRGRDRQRDQQKPQRPVAGLMDGLGDRPRAEIVGERLIGNPQRRQDGAGESDDL